MDATFADADADAPAATTAEPTNPNGSDSGARAGAGAGAGAREEYMRTKEEEYLVGLYKLTHSLTEPGFNP